MAYRIHGRAVILDACREEDRARAHHPAVMFGDEQRPSPAEGRYPRGGNRCTILAGLLANSVKQLSTSYAAGEARMIMGARDRRGATIAGVDDQCRGKKSRAVDRGRQPGRTPPMMRQSSGSSSSIRAKGMAAIKLHGAGIGAGIEADREP